MWYKSSCILRLGAFTAAQISYDSACVLTKKPGMSRLLIASRSSMMWCCASFPAAYLRFSIRVARQAAGTAPAPGIPAIACRDRKSTRLNSSHLGISYAVFCLKKKNIEGAGIDRPHIARDYHVSDQARQPT